MPRFNVEKLQEAMENYSKIRETQIIVSGCVISIIVAINNQFQPKRMHFNHFSCKSLSTHAAIFTQ